MEVVTGRRGCPLAVRPWKTCVWIKCFQCFLAVFVCCNLNYSLINIEYMLPVSLLGVAKSSVCFQLGDFANRYFSMWLPSFVLQSFGAFNHRITLQKNE